MAQARIPIIGGNWKMNTDGDSGEALAKSIAAGFPAIEGVETFICPPFPYLSRVASAIAGSGVVLAAQDVYFQESGAYTGEVSAAMLKDCGCGAVLLGHSERRHVIGETDD